MPFFCIFRLKIYLFADSCVQETEMMLRGDSTGIVLRFLPRMHRQGELIVVNRKILLRLQVQHRLLQALRRGVYIAPVLVILPVFQKRQIDLAKPFADLPEALVVTAVAADIDFSAACFD